jgi:hypothetical protein
MFRLPPGERFCPKSLRQTMGPDQPPIQWVPVEISKKQTAGSWTIHQPSSSSEVTNDWSNKLRPPDASTECIGRPCSLFALRFLVLRLLSFCTQNPPLCCHFKIFSTLMCVFICSVQTKQHLPIFEFKHNFTRKSINLRRWHQTYF